MQPQREDAKDDVAFHTDTLGGLNDHNHLLDVLHANGFYHMSFERGRPPGISTLPTVILVVLMVGWCFSCCGGWAGRARPSPSAAAAANSMPRRKWASPSTTWRASTKRSTNSARSSISSRCRRSTRSWAGGFPGACCWSVRPGTGKTLLAKAVAGEAGVPFFSLSGSDFVEMFVGVGAARVRDMFQQAQAKSPCIVFIDELDALGKTRGTNIVGGDHEREQTLNALLVEMDGFTSNSGVIVMAATNRPETLDPALLRPGRFDRHVLVDRPDVRGREDILEVHGSNVRLDEAVNLKEVARITSGFVGADLANLVNEAALLAARAGKPTVTMQEFNEGVDRVVAGLEKRQRDHARRREAARGLPRKAPCPGGRQPAQHRPGPQGVDHSPRAGRVGLYHAAPRGRPLPRHPERTGEPHPGACLAGTVAEEMVFGDVSTGARTTWNGPPTSPAAWSWTSA